MNRLAPLVLLLAAAPAFASEGHELPFSYKSSTVNEASLQRGARTFMDYCSGCHSLKYLRYNRVAHDLSIPEDVVNKTMNFGGAKLGETMKSAMPAAQAEQWFGRTPPDLSLTARERGANWVYSYLLSFYADPSRPTGMNNLVLPGVSMPHVLAPLQGVQVKAEPTAEGEHAAGHEAEGHGGHKSPLVLVQDGALTEGEYKDVVEDLTNFLVYAAEPGRNHRIAVGVGAMLFLALFTVLAYLLKVEYWKDVH